MNDTPARLLRLLSLLQTPREWPGSELADRLEVSPRTVRRDVERLRDLGYPVEATMGVHGGYRLVAGKAMPPLLLDDEEAVAVAIGLRTAARQAVAGIAEASLRALAKLQQVLPARLARRVGSLTAATVPSPVAAAALVDPAHLTVLAAAAAAGERVRLDYRSRDGMASRRLVEPHRLVAAGRRWYLVAYDSDHADWRTFRADRVNHVERIGVRVAPRALPADDAAAFVTAELYDSAPVYPAVATLWMPADQAAPGSVTGSENWWRSTTQRAGGTARRTRSTGWRSGSCCSAATSPSTSRPSWWRTCASWAPASTGRCPTELTASPRGRSPTTR